MERLLVDRKALILGGSGGIGYETARVFLREGARILIAGRTENSLKKACDRLGEGTQFLIWDIRDPKCASRKVEQAAALLGGLDTVVNCSGVLTDHDFADAFFDITPEEWDLMLS